MRLKGQQEILERFNVERKASVGQGGLSEELLSKNLDDREALSWEAQERRAKTFDDLATKATILEEWCVVGDGDLAHDLAFSLCQDILEIAEGLAELAQDPKLGGARR